ncbi:MAG: hypothetical protein PUA56_02315 [Bacillales bacterium]|nr:hypothetical protein [Bacillales bacterium]
MNKIEKTYEKYITSKINPPNIKDRIKSNISFKKKDEGGFMKKGLIAALSGVCTFAIIGGIVVGVCANNPNNTNKEVKALVNVDVNPQIEFAIDEDNKVISVSGLNDEGKMIIQGEVLVGKDIDEALELIIKIENDTGFLVSGNVTADKNNINISITAKNDEYVNELKAQLKDEVSNICEKYNIVETINTVQKYTKEELVEKALIIDPTLTRDEAEAMSIEDLLKLISIYHIDTAEIYSEKLEDLYIQVRDTQIEFAQSEHIQKAIDKVDALSKIILTQYHEILEQLNSHYEEVSNLQYSTFVDPTSDYQQALNEVKNAKAKLLEYRNQLANSDKEHIEYYQGLLDAASVILDSKQSVLETCESLGQTAIEAYKSSIQTVIAKMETIEATFPSDVKTYLNENATKLEEAVNNVKNTAFNKFEEKYKEDLLRAKNDLIERKQILIEAIKNA